MPVPTSDPHSLERFLHAQEGIYDAALSELRSGRKRSHWMWFIFPQLDGLGHSTTARYYAIRTQGKARDYLAHPVLGMRLRECGKALLAVEGRTANEIFGHPDELKLRSSLTLFSLVDEENSIFTLLLDKYFNGERDATTLNLIVDAVGC